MTLDRPAARDGAPTPLPGLSSAEVAARVAAGAVNRTPSGSGRSVVQILRANLLTRFNAILGTLFAVVVVFGPVQDALFGIVLAVNALVGIAQELRAKLALDRLTLLAAPRARAIRDGEPRELPIDEVVVDDLVEVSPGDQVVADGTLLEGHGVEVDESLLTGESLPVEKRSGDTLLSGSVVLAGTGTMRVVRVAEEAFAQRVQREAQRFDLVRSELRNGVNRILRVISWGMVPLGALVATSQLVRSHQSLAGSVRASVAGIGAMVPEGLVLLTTIAFAAGAVRLARRRVLVNELAAVEGLARVDVLCIDKTGTLTEPGLHLRDVVVTGGAPARDALGAIAASDRAPNATMLAARELPAPAGWEALTSVAFSSERKWSAVEFAGRGSWVVGAPDVVMPDLGGDDARRIQLLASEGHRVLLVARTSDHLSGDVLPASLACAGWAVFDERLRAAAAETVAYLQAQRVDVIVVSGDDPRTVASVAARVGIEGAQRAVHARSLPTDTDALAAALERVSVIGRVHPDQKRNVVRALQARGRTVAMTGDGVNDVPALKAADLGIAMGTGSPAARAIGRVVLLDSDFETVPLVLDEGRRVIANVERVARLFITKTVYAALLATVVGITAVPYPFYPRHLTFVSGLTIGVPGFFLAFAPGAPRARPGFLVRVLRFCVPAGIIGGTATFVGYLLARQLAGASGLAARTTAAGVLLVFGLGVLVLASRPLAPVRALVPALMALGAVLAWFVPLARDLFGLVTPPRGAMVAAALVSLGALVALAVAARVFRDPPVSGLPPGAGRAPSG